MNPGSTEAIHAGCACPTEPNQDGQGTFSLTGTDPAKTYFVIDEGCPMHGRSKWTKGDRS